MNENYLKHGIYYRSGDEELFSFFFSQLLPNKFFNFHLKYNIRFTTQSKNTTLLHTVATAFNHLMCHLSSKIIHWYPKYWKNKNWLKHFRTNKISNVFKAACCLMHCTFNYLNGGDRVLAIELRFTLKKTSCWAICLLKNRMRENLSIPHIKQSIYMDVSGLLLPTAKSCMFCWV